ncbi:MAG: hypothetical protein AB7O65_00170 [Candidatus Korobacteraceae bacterium]|jgi:hypothetical protein
MAIKQSLIGIGLALAILAPLAPAQEAASTTKGKAHPRSINNRQERQEKRIDKGVESGQLNEKEAARMEAQQQAIADREARMRESGGKFTKGERVAIQKQQNRTSRRIYKQKHDAQKAK